MVDLLVDRANSLERLAPQTARPTRRSSLTSANEDVVDKRIDLSCCHIRVRREVVRRRELGRRITPLTPAMLDVMPEGIEARFPDIRITSQVVVAIKVSL
jgi:hypothetical protein